MNGCQYCKMKKCIVKPMTNADRIRSYTDEELIDWLNSLTEIVMPWCDHPCPNGANSVCRDCVAEWLKQEAKE